MSPTFQFEVESLLKSEAISQKNIEILEEWCKEEKQNFPEINQKQIALFLLCCEDDVELAKKTIKVYFSDKAHSPEMFCDRNIDSDSLQKAIACTALAILPVRTEDKSVILMAKFLDTTYYNFVMEHQLKLAFMCIESALYSNPPHGLITLIDTKGFGFMHLTRFRIGVARKMLQYVQEGMQVKMKAVHVFNVAAPVQKLLLLLRPIMKKELFDVIHVHGSDLNMDDFSAQYIPKKCLPSDYGGDLPELHLLALQTCDNLRKLTQHFDEDEQQISEYRARKH